MSAARVHRRYRFRAAYHYGVAGWSAERNRAVFGAQTESHEHDWTLTIEVTGPPDPTTGFAVDLAALDALVAEVTEGWDGGDLNAIVPDVANGALQPSTEGLARWLHGVLDGRIEGPARLSRVRLDEDGDLGSSFPA